MWKSQCTSEIPLSQVGLRNYSRKIRHNNWTVGLNKCDLNNTTTFRALTLSRIFLSVNRCTLGWLHRKALKSTHTWTILRLPGRGCIRSLISYGCLYQETTKSLKKKLFIVTEQLTFAGYHRPRDRKLVEDPFSRILALASERILPRGSYKACYSYNLSNTDPPFMISGSF